MRLPMISAAAALASALCLSGAFAADFRAPYMPSQNDDVPVELGSGWYIRGDLAAAAETANTFGSASVASMKLRANAWSAGIGGGYKFNNWLRADVTLDARSRMNQNGFEGFPICRIGAGCNAGHLNRTHVLANIYADIGTWYGVTPYVGAGAGVGDIFVTTPLSFLQGQQTRFNAVRFAWALMGGVAVDLTPHVKLDVGYRFVSLGRYGGIDAFGTPVSRQLQAHEIRAGIRYTID